MLFHNVEKGEINHSDWLFQAMWLVLTNPDVLFQCSIGTLL